MTGNLDTLYALPETSHCSLLPCVGTSSQLCHVDTSLPCPLVHIIRRYRPLHSLLECSPHPLKAIGFSSKKLFLDRITIENNPYTKDFLRYSLRSMMSTVHSLFFFLCRFDWIRPRWGVPVCTENSVWWRIVFLDQALFVIIII